jgi:Zn-finger nucleic acid-binding protein
MYGKESWNRGMTFKRSDATVALLTQNALNRPRYTCPICEKDNLDGGNLSKHMNKKHDWTKEQVAKYKENK